MYKKLILCLILAVFIIAPLNQALAFTRYRFNAKPLDTESNLYYYGQRYYDPNIGRFTQPDPVANYLTNPEQMKKATGMDLQKFLENPQNLNSYSYTVNNPVKYTDPNGNFGILAILGAAATVGFFAWDAHDAYKTFNSTNATLQEKAINYGSLGLDFVPIAGTTKGFAKFGIKAFDVEKIAKKLAIKLDPEIAHSIATRVEDGFVKLYRGVNVEEYENVISEGFKAFKYITANVAEAGSYLMNKGVDPRLIEMKIPLKTFEKLLNNDILKKGSYGEEFVPISKKALNILNDYIIKNN